MNIKSTTPTEEQKISKAEIDNLAKAHALSVLGEEQFKNNMSAKKSIMDDFIAGFEKAADMSFLIKQVSKVYSHVTGNVLSKPFYKAEDVIKAADAHFNSEVTETIKERLEEMKVNGDISSRSYDEVITHVEKYM